MKKNNAKNPLATLMAFTTLGIVWRAVIHVIKKYHKKQEIFY